VGDRVESFMACYPKQGKLLDIIVNYLKSEIIFALEIIVK